jgi:hypothetical protein
MEMVRYCPRCASEYRLEILTCAECGGELEVREEGYHPPPEEPFPDVADGADEPPGEYRSLYYSGEIADLEPLADALGESRIPYRVDAADDTKVPLSPHNRFYLKVRDEEREQARQLLESLRRRRSWGLWTIWPRRISIPARDTGTAPPARLPSRPVRASAPIAVLP